MIRAFSKIAEVYLDMKESFNVDFLSVALSYRVCQENISTVIKGLILEKQVRTSEFEHLNFKDHLKVMPLALDDETTKYIEKLCK